MFGMKSKASLEDILDALSKLSEEEKDKVRESLSGKKETLDEKLIAKAKADTENDGVTDQSEERKEDESFAMLKKEHGGEGEQGAKAEIKESEDTKKYDEEHDAEKEAKAATDEKEDVADELKQMLTKLEARITALEKATERTADEEIGASDDLADTEGVFHRMPESYVERAKKMRY